MRRKIEELKTAVQEFVDQSDDLALVVNGTDTEMLRAGRKDWKGAVDV